MSHGPEPLSRPRVSVREDAGPEGLIRGGRHCDHLPATRVRTSEHPPPPHARPPARLRRADSKSGGDEGHAEPQRERGPRTRAWAVRTARSLERGRQAWMSDGELKALAGGPREAAWRRTRQVVSKPRIKSHGNLRGTKGTPEPGAGRLCVPSEEAGLTLRSSSHSQRTGMTPEPLALGAVPTNEVRAPEPGVSWMRPGDGTEHEPCLRNRRRLLPGR